VIGWLVDTNVIASLIAPNGAPSVKSWGRAVDERRLFISILTLAEYDKGIANLAGDDPNVQRYIAARDGLEARFTARILSLSDPVVRRWGAISGRVKRETGHPPPVIDTLLRRPRSRRTSIWFLVTRRICSTVEPLSSIHGAMTSPHFR
jgi:toxin FitB